MNKLKELRKEKGLSLQGLKDELDKRGINIARSSLSKYENGSQNPKKAIWEKLAEYYGVSVPYIMGLSEDNEKITKKGLADLILKANSSVHNTNYELDPDNQIRAEYLTSNIEAFMKVINSEIASDYESNSEVGQMVMDFLGTISYLIGARDTSSLESLQKIMKQLTSFGMGAYRGNIFVSIYSTKTKKGARKKLKLTASPEDAVKKYFAYSKQIKDILDDYFISEFNNRYKED